MPPQSAKHELRPGSMVAGKFKLQKQLGRGAAGVVWSAVNVATSRQVALKLLLRPEPKARERLLREARAAGALKHPNVVDVYDVILTDDGSPALVLELLEGQTLQQLLTERAPLPQAEAAAIGRDVARALAVAHASGIVHRDLKPANIFLHAPNDDPPVVKVVDFGISKNVLAGEGTLTETGMAVGSPSFMSPEQVRGERKLDGRTDLWALGVILYEMLSGKRLFDGRAHEVLTLVLTQPIKPLEEIIPGLDPALDRIVSGLLERDPAKRLPSAEAVADLLSVVAMPTSERPRQRTEPPPTMRKDVAVVPPAPFIVPPAPPTGAVPKIHADEEDDEATHVAPMMMRKVLQQKSAVPSIYKDEEEDDDRTRVAGDAELTAAVMLSKEPAKPKAAPPPPPPEESNQNTIPTVRPPPGDLSSEEIAILAENSPGGVISGKPEKVRIEEGQEGASSSKAPPGRPSQPRAAAPEEASIEKLLADEAALRQAAIESAAAAENAAPEAPPQEAVVPAPAPTGKPWPVVVVALVVLALVVVAVVLLARQ